MKRSILLVIFIAVAIIAGNVFGKVDTQKSKYALLRPVNSDGKNENTLIPLTAKEAKALLNKPAGVYKFNSPTAIIDTLISTPKDAGSTVGPYFGGDVGDSFAVYFHPGAGCKILQVGFNAGYWQNSADLTGTLWDGINMSLNFANYDGGSESGVDAGKYLLGEWAAGNVWTPAAWYAANYPSSPVGSAIWGSFPVSIIPEPSDAEEVIEMAWLGTEADNLGKDFAVIYVPYGAAGAQGGFDDTQNADGFTQAMRVWKWYSSDNKWYVRGTIGFYTWCLVEFYENTPPVLTPGGPYATVLTSDARTLECYATDIDANNAAQAGVSQANIVYSVNGGASSKAAMSLASGTKTDGLWKGDIPAGTLSPGDVVDYYFEMTDGAGLTTTSDQFSYGYFKKSTDILFYYNDATLSLATANTYYWYQSPHMHDSWNGDSDGAVVADLLTPYDYIVRIDGYSPVNVDGDVFQSWLASGTAEKKKYLFWSSQEFLGYETNWTDTTYAADDWHNTYLGIGAVKHDLQYADSAYAAYPTGTREVKAVANDVITGALAKLCADSSFQLLFNPQYELGSSYEWSDGLEAGPNAVVCFTDVPSGKANGLHKDGATAKTVFFALDQLSLDINPPYTNSNYHWPEVDAKETSVLYNSLVWFGAPEQPVAVDDNQPGLVNRYNLSQNYPNPFNPETRIAYSIAKNSLVKLSVYNVLGQKVAELINKQQAPGSYHITWNAGDLSSGVYFYRLEAGDYTRTLKMMLLH